MPKIGARKRANINHEEKSRPNSKTKVEEEKEYLDK